MSWPEVGCNHKVRRKDNPAVGERMHRMLFGVAVFVGRTGGLRICCVALDDVIRLDDVVGLECGHRIASMVGFKGMPSEDRHRYLTLIFLPFGGFAQ